MPSTGKTNESLIPDDPAERKTYAMRIIAQRCLYGVDKNPLAVEMAKLSLWLLTLAKDKPFEFLDHSIRCGDSLVGLHSIDQLRHYRLKPDPNDAVLFKGPLDSAVDEAINLRLKLEDLPTNTVEDVQRQEQLLVEANEKIARLRCAADLLVAAEFWGENSKDKLERVRHASNQSVLYFEKGLTKEFEQVAAKERQGQTMFHWPLEFPEVIVKRGGFDAFLGNPPFLGGLRITEVYGEKYNTWLVTQNEAATRKADLCAYFFVRAWLIINSHGAYGLLGSGLLADTLTRRAGLDVIESDGGIITRAFSAFRWPGDASTNVVMAWIKRGEWSGNYLLDGIVVEGISSSLTPLIQIKPEELRENSGLCFQGVNPLGMGFVIDKETAGEWIAESPKLAEVIFPYFSGKEINDSSDQEAVRSIINFGEMTATEAARYERAFAHVKNHVLPERATKDDAKYPRMVHEWWKFWHARHGMFEAIESKEAGFVFVCARVTKYISLVCIPATWVCSDKTIVFVLPQWDHYSVLQSSFHDCWARTEGSSRGDTFNYVVKSCFLTFPRPRGDSQECCRIGEEYNVLRKQITTVQGEGLTKIYNRFHNPDEISSYIQKLRDLHVEMDKAVAVAYGWSDLDLGHGFHETKQGVRFTISEPARREVLQRLLKLNHERYAEEVKQGLHDKKGAARKATPKRKTASNTTTKVATLFDLGEDDK